MVDGIELPDIEYSFSPIEYSICPTLYISRLQDLYTTSMQYIATLLSHVLGFCRSLQAYYKARGRQAQCLFIKNMDKKGKNNVKIYAVYIDVDDEVLKINAAAEDEEAARKYCEGTGGEIVAVKDVTEQNKINTIRLYEALERGGYSAKEGNLLVNILREAGLAED